MASIRYTTISFTVALAAIVVPMVGSASLTKQKWHVKVDGRTYRVLVKSDGEVEVANKAMITAYTMDERDRMREAVRQATGCAEIDEFTVEQSKLKGRLKCQPPVKER